MSNDSQLWILTWRYSSHVDQFIDVTSLHIHVISKVLVKDMVELSLQLKLKAEYLLHDELNAFVDIQFRLVFVAPILYGQFYCLFDVEDQSHAMLVVLAYFVNDFFESFEGCIVFWKVFFALWAVQGIKKLKVKNCFRVIDHFSVGLLYWG